MCEKGSELAAVGRWDALLVWLTSSTASVRILLATVARESRKVDAEAESRECDGAEQSIPGWRLRNQELMLRSAPGPATDRN